MSCISGNMEVQQNTSCFTTLNLHYINNYKKYSQ